MNNKIIAKQGNQYLIRVGNKSDNTGRILDLDRNILFPIQNLQSIFKFSSYWEDYTGTETYEDLMKNNITVND